MANDKKGKWAETAMARYLSGAVSAQQALGKSQRDIARELGYEKPNILSMMKNGETKVPLTRIPVFARVLNVDLMHLFRMSLEQIWSEEESLGDKTEAEMRGAVKRAFRAVATENEMPVLELLRNHLNGKDFPLSQEVLDQISDVLRKNIVS